MSLSCLTDPSLPIVADTSAVINLNASGCAAAVLRALPNRVVLTDVVLAELRTDKRTGRDDAKLVRYLIDEDLAAVAAVADLKKDHFAALVAGPAAETLDDGEAATIACALEINAVAIIDDRKAVSLCARKHPSLLVASTVDVFMHAAIDTALGHAALSDAMYAALQSARMRVPRRYEEWVVGMVGETRARLCPSLRGVLRTGVSNAVPAGIPLLAIPSLGDN
jgi:predicted nucleic acid-binding protein